MKRIASLNVVILISISLLSKTYAQYDNNFALGFRVGEPTGFNIRKYFNNGSNAFDLNIGSYGFLYNTTVDYNGGQYKNAGLMLQGHFLWNNELFGKNTIHWYYGFGGQINSRTVFEDIYINNVKNNIGTSKIALGGSAISGLEFALPDSNLGIFVDAAAYIEILPSPFHFNPEISAGLRLNLPH